MEIVLGLLIRREAFGSEKEKAKRKRKCPSKVKESFANLCANGVAFKFFPSFVQPQRKFAAPQ
jgi:hypothetical protein